MDLIFDIGMYDGADTRYYLDQGYRVVAVEANPNLVSKAQAAFADAIAAGQLNVVHAAVCPESGQQLRLNICGEDLGASSLSEEKIAHRNPAGTYDVSGITIGELMDEYGCPHFMKIDIEGADRHCILPMEKSTRPKYVSFEVGDDVEELIAHLSTIGYTKFKAINQCNFKEISNQQPYLVRGLKKLWRLATQGSTQYIQWGNDRFVTGHSSGPVPWVSDGSWQEPTALIAKWHRMIAENRQRGWYDIHAMQ